MHDQPWPQCQMHAFFEAASARTQRSATWLHQPCIMRGFFRCTVTKAASAMHSESLFLDSDTIHRLLMISAQLRCVRLEGKKYSDAIQ